MKLKFIGKSQDFLQNEPVATRVILGNEEGAVYPVFFDADYIEKPIEELEKLALEKIYQENFPHKAERDKFEYFDSAIKRADKATKENEQMLQFSLATMTALMEKLEEAGVITFDDMMEGEADEEASDPIEE